MNRDRVQNLIAYILMRAAEEEGGNRALRPIHILKYLYLADLAHAERRAGETYTGIPWRFHHYGPWDEDAWMEIEPTVQSLGATTRDVPSDYGDTIEYFAPSDVRTHHLGRLESSLPVVVSGAVDRAVHEHRNDTGSLLQAVYLTRPMRFTTPRQAIDFTRALEDKDDTSQDQQETIQLTAKQRRRRTEYVQASHDRIQAKLQERRARRNQTKSPWQAPRYDDVFEKGVDWLDSDAGEPITPTSKAAEAEFDDSV